MKKIILIIALIFSTNSFSQDYLHAIGGGYFGTAGYFLGLDLSDGNRSKAIFTGTLVGFGANGLKEVTDISKYGFDFKENGKDMLIGTATSYVFAWASDKLFYENWKTKKEKQKIKIAELENKRLKSLTDEEKLIEIIKSKK